MQPKKLGLQDSQPSNPRLLGRLEGSLHYPMQSTTFRRYVGVPVGIGRFGMWNWIFRADHMLSHNPGHPGILHHDLNAPRDHPKNFHHKNAGALSSLPLHQKGMTVSSDERPR
jgi:hypothetical protein